VTSTTNHRHCEGEKARFFRPKGSRGKRGGVFWGLPFSFLPRGGKKGREECLPNGFKKGKASRRKKKGVGNVGISQCSREGGEGEYRMPVANEKKRGK